MRFARSLGQGALAVDFALYARALHWSPAFFGAVLGAGLLFAAASTAIVGPLSDRLGRKPFLLAYEGFAFCGALAALFSASRWPLAVVAMLAGYGRGPNAAPGLFGVVEQAWLARSLPREGLARTFAKNAAAGFFGTAIGSALGGLPALWAAALPGALSYRPLFALAAVSEAVSFLLLVGTEDAELPAIARQAPAEMQLRRREHGLLARLAGLNALNGLGLGLGGPLVSWWLAERYGAGPATIGPAIGAALFFCGLSALGAGRVGRRFGAVRVVVAMRGVGLALLVLMPFAPNYPLAMLCYALRMILNRGTAGPRQALALGLVRAHRRGLAATVSSFSTQLPRALGPALTGVLFGAGALAAPFLLAALFQAGYLLLYPLLFAGEDPERPVAARGPSD
ncbi:MAG TPA: MFS transporter [Stellaceae bacterium]|nr:MFS transporter [Stellaceae bacterium]